MERYEQAADKQNLTKVEALNFEICSLVEAEEWRPAKSPVLLKPPENPKRREHSTMPNRRQLNQ
jgi:hypothetical protein